MLLIIPIRVIDEFARRGVVSIVLGGTLIYHYLLGLYDRALLAVWPYEFVAHPSFSNAIDFALGLFRSPARVDLLFFALSVLIFGPPVEKRVGSTAMILTFIVGAVATSYLIYLEILSPLHHYSPMLGGMLFVLGLFYAFSSLQDVRFFYFLLGIPVGIKFGYSETAGLLIIGFIHLLVWVVHQYTNFPYHANATGMIGPSLWLIAIPAVVCGVVLAIDRAVTLSNQLFDRLKSPRPSDN